MRRPSRADRTYLGTLAACGGSVPSDRAHEIAVRHRCEDPVVSTMDLVAWASHDIRDRAASITCPAVVAYGTDDFWIDGRDIELLARTIPGSRLERLDGIGHYPMEEIEDFPRLLASWLDWISDNTPNG
jgi:pimeloyl-ACP methyl ester carboxylesterase